MPHDTWHNGEVGYLGLRVLKWELWQFIPTEFCKNVQKIMRLCRLYSEIISNSNSTKNLVGKKQNKKNPYSYELGVSDEKADSEVEAVA